MNPTKIPYVYGPVPSRRLGRSLGIDLVPFKTCTYDCVYCHIGGTTNKTIERKEYVPVDRVLAELERKLAEGPAPDFISLAGSGEPTLNSRIGDLIARIKRLTHIPIAVITNGSLLWRTDVQEALMNADIVLPSLDAGDDPLFQYVNRPHPDIAFEKVLAGLADFTERFTGSVWLEVLLMAGVTGIDSEVEKIAALIRKIHPERVQLNTIHRPPAEEFAMEVAGELMERFRRCFQEPTEIITESARMDAPESLAREVRDTEILALLSRRPCTIDSIASGLGLNIQEVSKRLQALNTQGKIASVRRNKCIFYDVVRNR